MGYFKRAEFWHRTALDSSRSNRQVPPLYALRDTCAFYLFIRAPQT